MIMMKKRLKIWWMAGMTAAVLCLAADFFIYLVTGSVNVRIRTA